MRRLMCLLALLPLAIATGCGFQLRGAEPLPPVLARPYLETSDIYTPLYAALTSRLRAAGAVLAPSAAQASAVIRLHADETGRELLSVSASNRPGEYEVFYAVEYSVSGGGTELLARQQARLTRAYGYDETAVLAKEHEEQSLRVALAEELASLILRRLAAL
ncbi:MAG: LPS assembly lipoprotein LptE [Steroidobacteraceae bacterium]